MVYFVFWFLYCFQHVNEPRVHETLTHILIHRSLKLFYKSKKKNRNTESYQTRLIGNWGGESPSSSYEHLFQVLLIIRHQRKCTRVRRNPEGKQPRWDGDLATRIVHVFRLRDANRNRLKSVSFAEQRWTREWISRAKVSNASWVYLRAQGRSIARRCCRCTGACGRRKRKRCFVDACCRAITKMHFRIWTDVEGRR